MSATVRLGNLVARIERGKWSSDNEAFRDLCQEIAGARSQFRYGPDEDNADARFVAGKLGGEFTPAPLVPGPAGIIY